MICWIRQFLAGCVRLGSPTAGHTSKLGFPACGCILPSIRALVSEDNSLPRINLACAYRNTASFMSALMLQSTGYCSYVHPICCSVFSMMGTKDRRLNGGSILHSTDVYKVYGVGALELEAWPPLLFNFQPIFSQIFMPKTMLYHLCNLRACYPCSYPLRATNLTLSFSSSNFTCIFALLQKQSS